MADELRILFLSPEAVPFAKTGGLADVAGALPAALKRLGTDVRLVLPLYRVVREGDFKTRPLLNNLEIPLGIERLTADVLETKTADDIPVYLIERDDMYDRPNLYGSARGDHYDNLERFAFFAHASLRIAEAISFKPDVIHCHDWQTGLVPALLKGPYLDTSTFSGTSSVFTIHNIGYQGIFPEEKLSVTGLPKSGFFHSEGLEFWGQVSLLKAGIVYSEAITTVSPKYAEEIQTPEYGMGMEGILQTRQASLHGILNGVDYRLWDPAQDFHLAAKYSAQEMQGKSQCKEALIEEMGLEPSLQERPLVAMISRLDAQKGLDLVVKVLGKILKLDVGLIVLGSGDEKIQQAIRKAAKKNPGRVGLFIGFNEPLAHRIMGGADVFLIPSRYEPCGLTQMYALKYGTVPVVRSTGGLDDTIVPYDPKTREGNGFKFGPYKPASFVAAIRKAVDLFHNAEAWKKLLANGMKADFSWDRSAQSYLELYRRVIEKGSQRGKSEGA
ncbi:MAG: glycogen synthase GlgA [Desulfobacteraceae bacterium]|jgi:starch synthase